MDSKHMAIISSANTNVNWMDQTQLAQFLFTADEDALWKMIFIMSTNQSNNNNQNRKKRTKTRSMPEPWMLVGKKLNEP